MTDDPTNLLRQIQERDRNERAQRDAAARHALNAEMERIQRAQSELSALVKVLQHDGIPSRPLYRLTKQKSAVGSLWRQTSYKEYRKVGAGWLVQTVTPDSDYRPLIWHFVLADTGQLLRNALAVVPYRDISSDRLEHRLPNGPGLALQGDGFGGRPELCSPGEAYVVEDVYKPQLRLGVSADETARFFFCVVERNRRDGLG